MRCADKTDQHKSWNLRHPWSQWWNPKCQWLQHAQHVISFDHRKNILQTHCLGSHVGFRIASWIFMVFACCDLKIRARASSPISNGADSTAWFDCPWRRTLSSVQCLNGSRNLGKTVKSLGLNQWMDKLMGNSWDSIILKRWARQKISEDVQNVRSSRREVLVPSCSLDVLGVSASLDIRTPWYPMLMQFMQLRCSAVVKSPGPTPRSCSRRSYRQRATFQNAKMRCLAVCLIKMCRDLFIGISGSCRQRAKLFRCDMLDLIQDYSLSLCRWASWSSHLTEDHALEVRSLRASKNKAKHLEALSISFNLSPISTKPYQAMLFAKHLESLQDHPTRCHLRA